MTAPASSPETPVKSGVKLASCRQRVKASMPATIRTAVTPIATRCRTDNELMSFFH
jgi:hypothetical protein